MLELNLRAKTFGTRHVLAGIRFAAKPGEVLALLAPSGTGKTTTLRILLGLDKDFSGSVAVPRGRVGAVFQEPRLLPWLDVAANLRLVAPELRAVDIESFLHLAGFSDTAGLLPRALSLGMARRVALARALAVRPALLVMDEPFASLDTRLAAQLGRDITAHARTIGAVTVMATHDLEQALTIADRVLVLGGCAPATLSADLRAAETSAAAMRREFAFLDANEPAAPVS